MARCERPSRGARRARDMRTRTSFDEASFTPADWSALAGAWASLGEHVGRAVASGPEGESTTTSRSSRHGVRRDTDRRACGAGTGREDRIVPLAHADWLMHHCRRPELWLHPRDGHISILDACPLAMDWLKAHRERP
jgi:hypothetical protein